MGRSKGVVRNNACVVRGFHEVSWCTGKRTWGERLNGRPGSQQRSMEGTMAGGVEGRYVRYLTVLLVLHVKVRTPHLTPWLFPFATLTLYRSRQMAAIP